MSEVVRVFSTSWCPDCHRAKRLLDELKVPYVEIDIEQDEAAAEIVMANNEGKRRVPTLEIDGAMYGNPPVAELKALLRERAG